MALTLLKMANSALTLTTSMLQWSRWLLWGTPESPEMALARQNQDRLNRMESKLDQIWAMERGLPPVSLGNSFVLTSVEHSTVLTCVDAVGNIPPPKE